MSCRSIMLVSLVALFCHSAHAQARGGPPKEPAGKISLGGYSGDREAPHRTIVGQVLDQNGKPAVGAMVYLKDTEKSTTRIQAVGDDGRYQFGPLPLTVDFEMWAQLADKKTQVKPISSFITTNLLSITLHFPEEANTTPAPQKAPAPVVAPHN